MINHIWTVEMESNEECSDVRNEHNSSETWKERTNNAWMRIEENHAQPKHKLALLFPMLP